MYSLIYAVEAEAYKFTHFYRCAPALWGADDYICFILICWAVYEIVKNSYRGINRYLNNKMKKYWKEIVWKK